MDYVELNVPVADAGQAEIVTAMLADFPFESFAEEAGVLKAYIPKEALYGCKEETDRMLAGLGITGAAYIEIETQNWNALWESNFEPVEVDGVCTIRAPLFARARTGTGYRHHAQDVFRYGAPCHDVAHDGRTDEA